jgi:uncharacterized protein involved in exopolysaccharide biosynthesis
MNTDDPKRAAPNLELPPAGYFLVVPPKSDGDDDAIDIVEIARTLRRRWIWLLVATLLAGGITAVITLNMRNVYRANAVISPTAENSQGGSSLKNDIGAIGELAGIDLGGSGGRKVEAFATLMAPGFVAEYIQTNNLMPILYSERWDAKRKQWREGATPPTIEQGIKRFTNFRQINENTKSGLITLSMDWYSPQLAAQWANGQVALVNERLRKADVITSQKSLDFLTGELAKANGVELRMAISHLMETQENNEMLAKVQQDYAYHFIDPAVPPIQKVSPMRTVLSIAGAFVGFLLMSGYLILRERAIRRKSTV